LLQQLHLKVSFVVTFPIAVIEAPAEDVEIESSIASIRLLAITVAVAVSQFEGLTVSHI
jgi:hypothetical protein